jgi:ankyrin repeat protein
VAEALIKAGADINHKNKNGDSSLSLSIWKNHTELAMFLLDQGAQMHIDSFGDTQFIDATKHYNRALMLRLTRRGVDLHHRNNQGHTAEMLAPDETDCKDFILTLTGIALGSYSKIATDAVSAARCGDLVALQSFTLSELRTVEQPSGSTPLIAAAFKGHYDCVEYLLARGVDVNHRTQKGDSALSLSVWKGFSKTPTLLLAAGAQDHVDSFGDTRLIDACLRGNVLVIRAFLKQDTVSLLHQNKQGETAIDAVVKSQCGPAMELIRDEFNGVIGTGAGESSDCKAITQVDTQSTDIFDSSAAQKVYLKCSKCGWNCAVIDNTPNKIEFTSSSANPAGMVLTGTEVATSYARSFFDGEYGVAGVGRVKLSNEWISMSVADSLPIHAMARSLAEHFTKAHDESTLYVSTQHGVSSDIIFGKQDLCYTRVMRYRPNKDMDRSLRMQCQDALGLKNKVLIGGMEYVSKVVNGETISTDSSGEAALLAKSFLVGVAKGIQKSIDPFDLIG